MEIMQHTQLLDLNAEYLQSSENPETFLQEYNFITEELKKEINECKIEQTRLRIELDEIRAESKASGECVQQTFSNIQNEKCPIHGETESAIISNLEKRLSLMQMEKDSIFQLWQTSLKAIDVLEEELKCQQQTETNTKVDENELRNIKESYSVAIKELESKLLQSKEHFLMHEHLFQSNKSKIEELLKEKDELESKIKSQEEALKKLKLYEMEVEKLSKCKIELQERLDETQRRLANLMGKERESTSKVAEALELVEAAIREKDEAVEVSKVLRAKMVEMNGEYAAKLEIELKKIKELHDSNLAKYMFEIEELKVEIQKRMSICDRMQREARIAQEELDRLRQTYDEFCCRSETKMADLEKRLGASELKLKSTEDTWRTKYNEKSRILEEYEKMLNEKLPKEKGRVSSEVAELVKEVNERTKEAMEKYSNMERSLSRNLNERDKVDEELRNLQMTFEKEIERRNCEKMVMEMRIRELQESLRIGGGLRTNLDGFEDAEKNRKTIEKLRQINEARIQELTSHVENYQKLNQRWKEEIQLLTNKFKKHSREMKTKIRHLTQENEELNKELFVCRQAIARCS